MNFLLLTALCVTGTVYDDFFQQGNTAYQENRVDDAIVAYEQLVTAGVREAPVFYNLGTAYFHAGNRGYALLNFERALDTAPGYGPALRGIEAIAAVSDDLSALPPGFRSPWKGNTAPSRWGLRGLALVLWWSVWGILAVVLWWPPTMARYRLVLSVGFTLVVLALVLTLARAPDSAMVVAEELPVRYGPDTRDVIRDVLHAGDRVVLETSSRGWTRIETGSGQRGWVESAHLENVALPFPN